MEFKDYYQTFGVSREATQDEIRKAFRKLARKYHPDVSKEPDAEARMKEVNEANAVLSDPEKRAAYDQLGSGHRPGEEFRPPPDWDAGFEFSGQGFSPHEAADFSDFFARIFGGRGEAQGFRTHPGQHAQGEDHHAKVVLDIEDSFSGATRQISLRVPRLDEGGHIVLDTRTLNVKMPRGVRAGQIIRLAGQGAPGYQGGLNDQGGRPGDLLLEVQFRPHPRLRADGRDLVMHLPLAPWEAALGAVIPVETPGITLKVRIPPGARSGQQLRVRGKGLPSAPPGDLRLDLSIVVPPADTPRAKELYETMARELAFDARKTS
jgi:curved DNA-binding protein